jgi:hypothetical protein
MGHQTFFKHDLPSRVETAKKRKADADATWRAVCKEVDLRDGKHCRCCDKRSDPDATGLLVRGHRHHLVYRSAGGKDVAPNLVSLCADCHAAEHQHRLRIEGGDANGPLIFWRKDADDHWFIAREEIAVRVVRRD